MTAQAQAQYEEQRQAQVAIKGAFLLEFAQLYPQLNIDDIDGSAPAWIEAALASIRAWRSRSADVAARSYATARRLFVPGSNAATPMPQVSLDRDWVSPAVKSLQVIGPGELKKQLGLGKSEDDAIQSGLKKAEGGASRIVLNAGRDTTLGLVRADPTAVGWARVTDGNPCAFCLMLASRGFAYASEGTASFQAHDHCACVAVPAFSKDAAWPDSSRKARALYDEVAKGTPDPLNALRRHLAAEAKQKSDQDSAPGPRELASLIGR